MNEVAATDIFFQFGEIRGIRAIQRETTAFAYVEFSTSVSQLNSSPCGSLVAFAELFRFERRPPRKVVR
jgi:hypothetical protein